MILNTFPTLLTFGIFAPLILRVILGFIVINLGYLKLTSEKNAWQQLFETINIHPSRIFVKVLSYIEIIGGLMLIAGAYTQLTAMVFAVLFFCEAVLEYRDPVLEKRNLTFYILIFGIALSLIFLGAGALAIDLPL